MKIYKKFYNILSLQQRYQAIFISGLILVSMLLETVGIAAVVPVIGFIAKNSINESYPSLSPILVLLGNPTQIELIVGGMVLLMIFNIVRTIFSSYSIWKQNIFIYGLSADLSSRLFMGYLRQPWTFHLQRNSAELTVNVTNEVNLFIGTLQSCLLLATDGLVIVGIIIFLVFIEPLGTLTVIVILGFSAWIFHYIMKNQILTWGGSRQLHEVSRIQHLQQGFGGVKDVKLLGREDYFSQQFKMNNIHISHISAVMKTLSDLNRISLELVGIIGLAMLVIIMMAHGAPVESLVPIMGVFSVAAFKILPAINRVSGAVQNARFLLPSINKVYEEVRFVESSLVVEEKKPFKFESSIILKNVSFLYPQASKCALEAINFHIQRGSSVGFIGFSGAGKSTLIDIILGLLPVDRGQVIVDDVDIQSNLRGWQNQIGYVPQSIFLTDDTVRRNIAFGIPEAAIDEIAVNRALKAAQLDIFITSLPQGVHTLVGERGVRLSGGQRQRIGIARALYHDPSVLVFDEATSSLDLDTEKEVMEAVNALRGKKTLIIVAHRISTLVNCNELFKLESGKIIQSGDFACVTS